MSEEGDIDVESAEDVPDIAVEATATTVEDRSEVYSPTGGHMDKRAHHNALERRRRDHIKDSFHGLRDSIPSLHGEKISRAHILNKATDYIRVMQKSGLSREQEIQQLKRRNEILEEQVRALEAARALGSTENAEDILQSVAEKVESRQQQQQSKANSTSATTTSGKSERNSSVDKSGGGKASQQSSGGSSKQPTPVVVKGGETSNSLTTNHMSILAKNQSLLSALQKNLSSPNLPASIKSLAARVLASPLGRTQVSSGGNIPRGIVTATTVPKGSSFTSSPLPNTLQQQLQPQQQAKTNQTHTKSSLTDTPPKVPTAANTTPSTNEHASPVITNCSKPPNTHSTATVSSPDKTAVESPSPSPLTQTTNSDDSKAATAVVSSAPSSSSSTITTSVNAAPITASSLASQLLDAHSLLQQQGAGATNSSPAAVVNSTTTIPLISPELLAQVSSFLNVPGQNASLADASESVAGVSTSESSDQDSLSVDASLQGIKRPSSSQELDSEHSVKKIHLEA